MVCNGYMKSWQLAPGELVHLDGARGTRLQVTSGLLWITLERDLRDIVVGAGDTFIIDRGGATLVEAQRQSTVCVDAHHVDERRATGTGSRILSRVRALLARAIAKAESRRRVVPYL